MWASRLAEFEASGARLPVVHLSVHDSPDAEPLAEGIRWLAARGRRVLVGTRVVLPRPVVEALGACGGVVVLGLASGRPEVQSALLGAGASPVARLLLHAQHLSAHGVAVGVAVGPLIEAWHEQIEPTRTLWRHVAAADLRDASLWSAPLGGHAETVLRARGWSSPWLASSRMDERTRVELLRASVRREAETAGIVVNRCGCSGFCHLGAQPARYVPTGVRELFPHAV